MRPIHILVSLALAALTSGCAAAVLGVGAGVVISSEVAEGSHIAHLNQDPARVWVVSKSGLSHMASGPIHVDEDLRRLSGTVDGNIVTVNVEVYDVDRALLRVSAKRYGVAQSEVAEMVLNRLISRLKE